MVKASSFLLGLGIQVAGVGSGLFGLWRVNEIPGWLGEFQENSESERQKWDEEQGLVENYSKADRERDKIVYGLHEARGSGEVYGTMEKMKRVRLGMKRSYPEYLDDVIDETKESTAEELILRCKLLARELLRVHEESERENNELLESLPQHCQDLYKPCNRNFVFDRKLLKRALEKAPARLKEKSEKILEGLKREAWGFDMDPPPKTEIPDSGFFERREVEEIEKEFEEQQERGEDNGDKTEVPKYRPWWGRATARCMFKAVIKNLRQGLIFLGKREQINARPPISFPVPQNGKVRLCTDFRKRNLYQVAGYKLALSRVRSVIEIQNRMMAKRKRGKVIFQEKKDFAADKMREEAERKGMGEIEWLEDLEETWTRHPAGVDGDVDTDIAFVPGAYASDLEATYSNIAVKRVEDDLTWLLVPEGELKCSGEEVADETEGAVSIEGEGIAECFGELSDLLEKAAGRKPEFHFVRIWCEKGSSEEKLGIVEGECKDKVLVRLRYTLLQSKGCLFGSKTSIYEAVSATERHLLVLRLILRLVVTQYIDDTFGATRRKSVPACAWLLSLYWNLSGKRESIEKSETLERIRESLTHLGVTHTLEVRGIGYSIPEKGILKFEKRLREISEQIRGVEGKRVTLEGLQKVVGLFRWQAALSRSETVLAGATNLWLKPEFFKKQIRRPPQRQYLLAILEQMLAQKKVKLRNSLESADQKEVVIYTDASGNFKEAQKEAREGKKKVNWEREDVWIGGFCDLSEDEELRKFGQVAFSFQLERVPEWVAANVSSPNIGIPEALGAIAAPSVFEKFFGLKLNRRFKIRLLDNEADARILSYGSSACPVLRALAHALWREEAEKNSSSYFRWIAGEKNDLGDCASRLEKVEQLKQYFPEVKHLFLEGEDALKEVWKRSEESFQLIRETSPGGREENRKKRKRNPQNEGPLEAKTLPGVPGEGVTRSNKKKHGCSNDSLENYNSYNKSLINYVDGDGFKSFTNKETQVNPAEAAGPRDAVASSSTTPKLETGKNPSKTVAEIVSEQGGILELQPGRSKNGSRKSENKISEDRSQLQVCAEKFKDSLHECAKKLEGESGSKKKKNETFGNCISCQMLFFRQDEQDEICGECIRKEDLRTRSLKRQNEDETGGEAEEGGSKKQKVESLTGGSAKGGDSRKQRVELPVLKPPCQKKETKNGKGGEKLSENNEFKLVNVESGLEEKFGGELPRTEEEAWPSEEEILERRGREINLHLYEKYNEMKKERELERTKSKREKTSASEVKKKRAIGEANRLAALEQDWKYRDHFIGMLRYLKRTPTSYKLSESSKVLVWEQEGGDTKDRAQTAAHKNAVRKRVAEFIGHLNKNHKFEQDGARETKLGAFFSERELGSYNFGKHKMKSSPYLSSIRTINDELDRLVKPYDSKRKEEVKTKEQPRGCFVNAYLAEPRKNQQTGLVKWYRAGIAPHSDDEAQWMGIPWSKEWLREEPFSVIGFSLGAECIMNFEKKAKKGQAKGNGPVLQVRLRHGSVIAMLGKTQYEYKHSIRESVAENFDDIRLSMTFRVFAQSFVESVEKGGEETKKQARSEESGEKEAEAESFERVTTLKAKKLSRNRLESPRSDSTLSTSVVEGSSDENEKVKTMRHFVPKKGKGKCESVLDGKKGEKKGKGKRLFEEQRNRAREGLFSAKARGVKTEPTAGEVKTVMGQRSELLDKKGRVDQSAEPGEVCVRNYIPRAESKAKGRKIVEAQKHGSDGAISGVSTSAKGDIDSARSAKEPEKLGVERGARTNIDSGHSTVDRGDASVRTVQHEEKNKQTKSDDATIDSKGNKNNNRDNNNFNKNVNNEDSSSGGRNQVAVKQKVPVVLKPVSMEVLKIPQNEGSGETGRESEKERDFQLRYGPSRRVWKAEEEPPNQPYGKNGEKGKGFSGIGLGARKGGVTNTQGVEQKGEERKGVQEVRKKGKNSPEQKGKWNVWEKKEGKSSTAGDKTKAENVTPALSLFSSGIRAGKGARAVSNARTAEAKGKPEASVGNASAKNNPKGRFGAEQKKSQTEERGNKNAECRETGFEGVVLYQDKQSEVDEEGFKKSCAFMNMTQGRVKEGEKGELSFFRGDVIQLLKTCTQKRMIFSGISSAGVEARQQQGLERALSHEPFVNIQTQPVRREVGSIFMESANAKKHGSCFEGAFVVRGVTQLKRGKPIGDLDSEQKRLQWIKQCLAKAAQAVRENGIGLLLTPLIGSGRGGMRKSEIQQSQKLYLAQMAQDLKEVCRVVIFGHAREGDQ